MKNRHTLILLLTLTAVIFQGCLINSIDDVSFGTARPSTKTPIVAAYLQIGSRKLNVSELNLQGVNFVNLAFTTIKNNRIGFLYPNDANNFRVARKLKRKYPAIKVLVSVGGANTSALFSDLVSSKQNRDIFVEDAVKFVRSYGLDGIDIDWEFPGLKKATRNSDRTNFTALISELKNALNTAGITDGKKYYLTIASGAFKYYLDYVEPIKLACLVDYFHIMTYDFYGQWNDITGHHANLFPSELKPAGYSVRNITELYIKSGIPREKIIIGAAFYGRKWKHVPPANHGLYEKGKGVGSINYRNIKALLANRNSGFTKYWDTKASAPYLYNSTSQTFISYEDTCSVLRKTNYAYINQLGGIMYWEHFSDCDGELSGTIIRQAGFLKKDIPLFRLPGGLMLYARNK